MSLGYDNETKITLWHYIVSAVLVITIIVIAWAALR